MNRKLFFTTLIIFCIVSNLFNGCEGRVPADTQKPRLVVNIVVDQMRADHLTRFAKAYQYGLARLLENGAVFSDAHQDHAQTVTGAGHATITSGCFPSYHGIISNNWFDRKTQQKIYCCEDREAPLLGYPNEETDEGRSPRQLLVSTLGDWLKAASPNSKVFGVARKDRAAILSTGHKADGAYWYNSENGRLITSEYYTTSYPDWVKAFNESGMVNRYFESGWHKKLQDEAIYQLAREDDFKGEWKDHTTFPHPLNEESQQPDEAYYSALEVTPYCEEFMLEFAKEMVRNEKLGGDENPDLLFVGCSAADAIGHRYGPFSQEALDYYIRLDQYLGDFFDFLDKEVGAGNYMVMLSSDHGVLPLPEELIRQGLPARRITKKEISRTYEQILEDIAKATGVADKLLLSKRAGGLYLNYGAAEQKGISAETLDKMFIEKIKSSELIEEIYSKEELINGHDKNREYFGRFQRSYHRDRSGDLMIQGKKYYLVKDNYGTSHGSTYDHDTHVPLLFWGPGINPGKYTEKVRTVDIAPTLAEILNISPPKKIDGSSLLNSILKRQRMDK